MPPCAIANMLSLLSSGLTLLASRSCNIVSNQSRWLNRSNIPGGPFFFLGALFPRSLSLKSHRQHLCIPSWRFRVFQLTPRCTRIDPPRPRPKSPGLVRTRASGPWSSLSFEDSRRPWPVLLTAVARPCYPYAGLRGCMRSQRLGIAPAERQNNPNKNIPTDLTLTRSNTRARGTLIVAWMA